MRLKALQSGVILLCLFVICERSAALCVAEEVPTLKSESGTSSTIVEPITESGTLAAAIAAPEPPPKYKLLRYDEDYSYLQDPGRILEPWDQIKYLPLGTIDDAFLSVGGEVRERFEFYHNGDFAEAPASSNGNNGYLLQRYMLHADAHFGPNLRLFGQSISGFENGRIGGPRPDIDQDTLDVHQAFADLVLPLASEGETLTFRLGRQEMAYGSGRLIDVREGPNLRRSFDEARALLRVGDWSIDGWWSQPVLNRTGTFDDKPDPSKSFWGTYAIHPLNALPDGHIDLYYLGYTNSQAEYNQGTGSEVRHSLGTRLWGNPLPWEYNLEYVWQLGTFGAGSINAWTAAHAVRYNWAETSLKPRLGLRADVASGDRSSSSANLQTFNPLFPSGIYFNLANPVGPSNMIDIHPVLDLHPTETVTITLDWDFFWRESTADGVYRLSGSVLKPAGTGNARFVGHSPSLTAVWNPTRHISVLASYVHFSAGEFIRENPPSKDIDFFTTWVTYKF